MTMFKKSMMLAVTAVIASALISACGANTVDTGKLNDLKDKVEQQESSQQKDQKKKKKTKKKTEQEEEANGLFAKAFRDKEVENNGGAFVRVANRVYYRVYSPRCLALTVIGLPSVDETNTDTPSKLMYYDLDEEKSVEVCEVSGVGSLYATIDGICLDSYPDGAASTTLIDENGAIDEHCYAGNITDVSADGRSVVIGESDENDYIVPCMYRDKERIGIPNDGEEDSYCSSFGFAGNSLIVRLTSGSASGECIYSFDENGKLTKLGDIEPFDMETYTLSPVVEELAPSDEKSYLSVSFRDGTANALVAWRVYSLTPGAEGSLELYDEGEATEEYDYETPKITVNDGYPPLLSAHAAGDVYLSEGTWGDLMCVASDSKKVLIREDFVSKPDEFMTYVQNIDNGHCFDNSAVFFLDISGQRSPDDDAGWRWAYQLIEIDYRIFRFDKDHTENGMPMSDMLEYIRSVGWDKGEIEYDRLVGEWEADSYNVEGEFRIAEEENSQNREMIRFDENGDAMIFFKDRADGKITNERPMHRAQEDEFLGGDYAYFYHSEDEDPLRAGVAYLSGGALKINYLYHFDGGSTGWYEIRYTKADN